jgi:ABC-type antimicrobial peptide transport system permease subunit
VGVVDDVPYDAEGDLSRKLYIPHAQFAADRIWTLIQTVKVRPGSTAAEPEIRRVLSGIDPELVLYHPRTMDDVIGGARAQDRFATTLMGAFALLALVLALVGSYGVLAGSVAARTREFGIRIALGADRSAVRLIVLRHATALVAPGVLLGLAGAWLASRWVGTLLFNVKPTDPAVYAAAVALFFGLGVVAGWIPARRATRVDPVQTLSAQ